MNRWGRFQNWVRFGDAHPHERLTVSLVEIFSLLDACRHRPWGGGHHPDISGHLLEGGLPGGTLYILPASSFSEECSGCTPESSQWEYAKGATAETASGSVLYLCVAHGAAFGISDRYERDESSERRGNVIGIW